MLVRARLLVLKPVPLGCRAATYRGQANRGGSSCVLVHFTNRWGIVLGDVLGVLRNCFRGNFGASFFSSLRGRSYFEYIPHVKCASHRCCLHFYARFAAVGDAMTLRPS